MLVLTIEWFCLKYFVFLEESSDKWSKIHIGRHVQYPTFLLNLNFLDIFSKLTQIRNFMIIRQVVAYLLNADGRTDGQRERHDAFRNFAKPPNGRSRLHCLKHSWFAVLVVRRETFNFSVVSRRGVRNCNNLAKSIKSNTKQKLAKKVISKETPCTLPSSSKFIIHKSKVKVFPLQARCGPEGG